MIDIDEFVTMVDNYDRAADLAIAKASLGQQVVVVVYRRQESRVARKIAEAGHEVRSRVTVTSDRGNEVPTGVKGVAVDHVVLVTSVLQQALWLYQFVTKYAA